MATLLQRRALAKQMFLSQMEQVPNVKANLLKNYDNMNLAWQGLCQYYCGRQEPNPYMNAATEHMEEAVKKYRTEEAKKNQLPMTKNARKKEVRRAKAYAESVLQINETDGL